jgi:hypothetical protein
LSVDIKLIFFHYKVIMMKRMFALWSVFLVLGCISPDQGNPSTTSTVGGHIQYTTSTIDVRQLKDSTSSTLTGKVVVSKDEAIAAAASDCSSPSDERVKNICLRDSAVGSGNPNGCAAISTANVKDECYYKIAINKGMKSVCDRIVNPSMRKVCVSKTA